MTAHARINRARNIILMALVAAILGFSASAALADHASWNHHHLHYWEEGPSNYGSYADVGATDNYDYGHAQWQRWTTGWSFLDGEITTCTGGNEACGYRKTYTRYFAQTAYIIRSLACANDGTHKLSGIDALYSYCSPQGLQTHEHVVTLN